MPPQNRDCLRVIDPTIAQVGKDGIVSRASVSRIPGEQVLLAGGRAVVNLLQQGNFLGMTNQNVGEKFAELEDA